MMIKVPFVFFIVTAIALADAASTESALQRVQNVAVHSPVASPILPTQAKQGQRFPNNLRHKGRDDVLESTTTERPAKPVGRRLKTGKDSGNDSKEELAAKKKDGTKKQAKKGVNASAKGSTGETSKQHWSKDIEGDSSSNGENPHRFSAKKKKKKTQKSAAKQLDSESAIRTTSESESSLSQSGWSGSKSVSSGSKKKGKKTGKSSLQYKTVEKEASSEQDATSKSEEESSQKRKDTYEGLNSVANDDSDNLGVSVPFVISSLVFTTGLIFAAYALGGFAYLKKQADKLRENATDSSKA